MSFNLPLSPIKTNQHAYKPHAWVLSQLDAGNVVITPTSRLSLQLQRDYLSTFAKNACIVAPSFHWDALCSRVFQKIQLLFPEEDHPLLLSATQQYTLWEKVLTEASIPATQALITALHQTLQLCKSWNVPLREGAFQTNAQSRQFQYLALNYMDLLEKQNALINEDVITYCMQAQYTPVLRSFFKNASCIWLAFDRFTPRQMDFQSYLEALSMEQIHCDIHDGTAEVYQFAAHNQQQEQEELLAFILKESSPSTKIAVVVPNLQDEVASLRLKLLEHLPEESFNISLGAALSHLPMIQHALEWLRFDLQEVSHQQLTLLLRSPFVAGASLEFTERMAFLENNEVLQKPRLPYAYFCDTIASLPLLQTMCQGITPYPEEDSPFNWSMHFKVRLQQFGFPGSLDLNSQLYQYYQRLMGLLEEFRELGFIEPRMSKARAVEKFSLLAEQTIFQGMQSVCTIHILGLLEASGLYFDKIWVMGLTGDVLPASVRFSPFIPIALQKKLQMPRSNEHWEVHMARAMIDKWQHACQKLVLSYPKVKQDIPTLPCSLLETACPYHPLGLHHETQSKCITRQEVFYQPLSTDEIILGGSALLSNQAKCPFRGFAAHRLMATEMQKPYWGLNASERGQLMHGMQERLWKTLKNQQSLLALSDFELDKLLQQLIQIELRQFKQKHPLTLSPLLEEVESARLLQLMHTSLLWEKERPPFEIHALEVKCTLEIAGLALSLRVDRMDNVGDTRWLIDYKTSIPTQKPWFEERPEESQILLYALVDNNTEALLFLELKTGQLKLHGVAEQALLKGMLSLEKEGGFTSHKELWQTRLETLAKEFQSGWCAPTPAREENCQRCEFQDLCRKREQAFMPVQSQK